MGPGTGINFLKDRNSKEVRLDHSENKKKIMLIKQVHCKMVF